MKIVKFIFSILLLPLCISLCISLITIFDLLLKNIKFIYFLVGFILYLPFQFVYKPLKIYIFGHEITHGLASIIRGGKIKSFNVSRSRGSVSLTKVDTFVAIAPYFFPIYTFFLLLLWFFLTFAWEPIKSYHNIFLVIVGFSLSFHIFMSFFALKSGQKDISFSGSVYSLVLIFMFSCVILSFILWGLFPESVSIKKYFVESFCYAKKIYINIHKWFIPK